MKSLYIILTILSFTKPILATDLQELKGETTPAVASGTVLQQAGIPKWDAVVKYISLPVAGCLSIYFNYRLVNSLARRPIYLSRAYLLGCANSLTMMALMRSMSLSKNFARDMLMGAPAFVWFVNQMIDYSMEDDRFHTEFKYFKKLSYIGAVSFWVGMFFTIGQSIPDQNKQPDMQNKESDAMYELYPPVHAHDAME
jgi:hypothetical protein